MTTIKKSVLLISVILFLALNHSMQAQYYGWNSIGTGTNNGTNGVVNAIAQYNNQVIFAGAFSKAGIINNVNNIAGWNDPNWNPLGNGLNDTVRALTVYNGSLIAGGRFTNAGNRIAVWNGSTWSSLDSGMNDQVYALAVFNGNLIAAGKFTIAGSANANRIAQWNGSSWTALGSGMNDEVYALTIYSGKLIAGGKFTTAGGITANRIAQWNGSSWDSLRSGMDERVFALTTWGGWLVAGGSFLNAGGGATGHVAAWTGNSWFNILGVNLDNDVYSLAYFNGSLIIGGGFRNAGSLFVNRICKWDGAGCTRMITGSNGKVNALLVNDTNVYSGGEFTTAGGDYSFYSSVWTNQTIHSVSGTVRYADNNQLVTTGVVKAERMDVSTKEVVVVDSALIQSNGTYSIQHGRNDSTFIVAFPNDELLDNFVPTFHPSSTDWSNAQIVIPNTNLSSIDILVFRVTHGPAFQSTANISGHVYLNFSPQQYLSGFPFSKDGIVYARQNGIFKKFAVSDSTESYSLAGLPPGTYDLYANRIGYTSESKTVVLGAVNLDTINFYLDTISVIGVRTINTKVPDKYNLFQNYPNPFNPSTRIKFAIDKSSPVQLTVYDILGREVAKLVDEKLSAGNYEVIFNADNLSSGIYFYRLTAGSFTDTKKMVVLK